MATLTSEYQLQCMPGPKCVPNFDHMTKRKPMNKPPDYEPGSDLSSKELWEKNYDCEKACAPVKPSKRQSLEFKKGVSREQALFGSRQYAKDGTAMKSRHVQDLTSLEQIDSERLDPDCCKRMPLGFFDFYMMGGREKEKMRASSPPRQNPTLMDKSKCYRELRPGEGKLNNIMELSKVGGEIAVLRRERRFIPMSTEEMME